MFTKAERIHHKQCNFYTSSVHTSKRRWPPSQETNIKAARNKTRKRKEHLHIQWKVDKRCASTNRSNRTFFFWWINVPEILTSENLSLPITHLDSYVPTLPLYVTRDTVMNATLMHLLIPLVTHRWITL